MSPQVLSLSSETFFIIWLTQLFFFGANVRSEEIKSPIRFLLLARGKYQRTRKTKWLLSTSNNLPLHWKHNLWFLERSSPLEKHGESKNCPPPSLLPCSIERKTVEKENLRWETKSDPKHMGNISPWRRWIAPVKGESFISIVLPLTCDKATDSQKHFTVK